MIKKYLLQPCFFISILVSLSCAPSKGPSAATPGPACNGTSSSTNASVAASGNANDNVLNISVGNNTSLCRSSINIPCTSVTICEPGSTTHCQIITDILVDTGSYGLRVFAQAMPQSLCNGLTQVTDSSGDPIAECETFGIGADWGSVMKADVQLGTENVIHNLPIQVINANYALLPSDCSGVDTSPSQAGYNGILGIGPLAYDCGTQCVTDSSPEVFWSCPGGNCSPTTLPLTEQVQNPVTALTADGSYTDNNGVIIDFSGAAVGANGAPSVTGSLILGIATGRANNTVTGGPTAYSINVQDNFPYIFATFPSGSACSDTDQAGCYAGFLDTGSNGLFFADSSIPTCADNSIAPGFFCPGSTQNLSATLASGGSTGTANFSIANAVNLVGNPANWVFTNIGGDTPIGGTFDFGFPYFLGKRVYVVNENGTVPSLGGAGPTWAY